MTKLISVAVILLLGAAGLANAECGGSIKLNYGDPPGYISTPNYPQEYTADLDCIWVISVPSGNKVQIDFEDAFDVEPESRCTYDALELYDGSTSNNLITRLCGDTLPLTQMSTGPSMTLRFYSDSTIHHKGFKAKYSIGASESDAECWTKWFDRDNPNRRGDFETLAFLHQEYPGKICETPLQIEVQTTSGASVDTTGDTIDTSDTTTGFICRNSDQKPGRCSDYKVRFQCPRNFCCREGNLCWTNWYDSDDPDGRGDRERLSVLQDKYPGEICDSPQEIEAMTVDGTPAGRTNQSFKHFSPTEGLVCWHDDQQPGIRCYDYKVRFGCQCPMSAAATSSVKTSRLQEKS
ncbi:uncharacterized protein ACBR49_016810 [Aulostomus maculatus]